MSNDLAQRIQRIKSDHAHLRKRVKRALAMPSPPELRRQVIAAQREFEATAAALDSALIVERAHTMAADLSARITGVEALISRAEQGATTH